jgi:hypothetical protein
VEDGMGDQKRGSDALLEAWRNGGTEISEEFVRELAGVQGLSPVSVLTKGQPRPDSFRATFEVDGDSDWCGTVVKGILGVVVGHGVPGVPKVVVNPRGVPVCDGFQVEVSAGFAR